MTHPGSITQPQAASGLRLRGRALLLARIAWAALAALALAIFVAGLPSAYALSDTLCRATTCTNDQLTPAAAQQLQSANLSLAFFARFDVTLKGLTLLVFLTVALVIFWRAYSDRVALVAAFTFITFPVTVTHIASMLPAAWVLPAQMLDVLGSGGMTLLLLTFPNGHFVPRWAGWVWLANQIVYTWKVFFPSALNGPVVAGTGLIALVTFLSAVQIYRYRRISTPVERQQTKWVVLGLAVGFIALSLIIATSLLVPDLASRNILLYLAISVLNFLFQLLFPLAIGVALLRYRLWDVDALIGRVVTYGLLTGLLGALYAGMILVLQNLAGRFTHQGADNPLALVVSTLAIAALVQPVRRWLQQIIDRRFYRAKHDAARTLEAFGAALRQQTDLEQVRARLLAVVDETMRPVHVSLWLRTPGERDAVGGRWATPSFLEGQPR
jgi:hypothetical protein